MRVLVHLNSSHGAVGMRTYTTGLVYALNLAGIQPRPIEADGFRSLYSALSRHSTQPAIYHGTESYDYLPIRVGRLRQVVTIQDLLTAKRIGGARPHVRLRASIMNRMLVGVDAVVTTSEAVAAQIQTRVPVVPLRPGLPPDFLEAVSRAPGEDRPPYVLYSGGHHPRKRFELAIEAVRRLQRIGHSATLVATGSGTDIPGLVEFIGAASVERLANLYVGAQAVLYPSTAEGFGLPVLEAAAAGVPCVTTSAVPAAIEDPACAASRVLPVAAGPEVWAQAILEAREIHVVRSLTPGDNKERWATFGEGLVDLYNKVL